ncbi:MAG TPA: transcriptional regulator NrdR [Anaerolineae bacterium]|nr:transcriptional regulator NrdR [Anaerolineae bacterium]HQK13488.1 transcriptional regulator NrdR [Anaerolineae bacterium]
MKCPYCSSEQTRVIDSRPDAQGNVRRRRECESCERRFTTLERAILTTPLVIKRDGRREEFDAHKLISGLRIACARRPISAEALERIVERVEYAIRQTGKTEVPSRVIGDIVIDELRQLDEVAYIRYAIVYLGLSDLEAIRNEIERLRSGQH